MEKHEHYTYRITWSAEDREYVGLCAEFPSLSWLAATRTGALEGIEKVVSETIDDMLAQGETPPQAGGKELQRKTGVAHDAGTASAAGDRRDGGRREPEPLSVRTPGGIEVQGRHRAALIVVKPNAVSLRRLPRPPAAARRRLWPHACPGRIARPGSGKRRRRSLR